MLTSPRKIIERVHVATPTVVAGGAIIASPFQFLFDGADQLRFRVTASAAVTVMFTVRFLDEKGELQVFNYTVSALATRVTATRDVAVGRGFLLNLAAFVQTGTPQLNQVYAQVYIMRGAGGATVMMGQLLGQYITAQQPAAWPGSLIAPSTDGAGALVVDTVAEPAAGDDWSATVPTGALWSINAIGVSFICGFDGTKRTIGITIRLGTDTIAVAMAPVIWRALDFYGVYWSRSQVERWNPALETAVASLPALDMLPPGAVIAGFRRTTQAASDQWESIVLSYREWLDVR